MLQQALARARDELASSPQIEDPALEAEVLLRHLLRLDRIQLRLDPLRQLNPDHEKKLLESVKRRLQGEPLAYITGSREFFGLDFYVDKRALIPRPETELLVEEALKLAENYAIPRIADVGTGGGPIAISLAAKLPRALILALDISPDALEVARLNSHRHSVENRLVLLQGDLLQPLNTEVDIVVANLPYVKRADCLTLPFAAYEPVLALDGGENGLAQIFRLLRQAKARIHHEAWLLLEIGMGQSPDVILFCRNLLPEAQVKVMRDLAGIERLVVLHLLPLKG